MKEAQNLYKKHVFVCTNEREEGKDCCIRVGGLDTFNELKQFVRDKNLADSIRVTKALCLGQCNNVGCTIVVYPEGKWFQQTTKEDIEKIKEDITKLD